MKAKKNSSADLEKKRTIFFQIGLVISCALTLVAFEWTTAHKNIEIIESEMEQPVLPIEEVFIITPNQKPKPEPIQTSAKKDPNKIEVVKDLPKKDPNQETSPQEVLDPGFADTLIMQPEPKGPVIEKFNYDEIKKYAEVMPSFPGGIPAFYDYLKKNIRVPKSLSSGEKKFYVLFVVNKDGSVTNVEIKSKAPVERRLKEEAIRVVKNSPSWSPGKQGGRKVRVQYTLPFKVVIH